MVSSKLVAAVGAVIGTLPALADVYPIVLNAYSPMITYKGSWNQSTNEPYNAGAYSTINERYVLGVGGCCNWPTIQYSFIGTKLLFNGYWGSPGDIELTIDGGTASKVATPDNWTKGSGPATIVTASLSSGYHSVNYQVNSGFMDIYSLTAFTEFSGVS
jgi:hypothetical protein